MSGSRLVSTNPPPLLTEARVVEWIRTRSLADLSALIAALEDRLGLSAVPVAEPFHISNPPWLWEESNPPVAVWLMAAGPLRSQVILTVRRAQGLPMVTARALVDRAPTLLAADLDREQGLSLVRRLEALGATAELR